MRVGIVGCGLIGKRRAAVARESGDRVVMVADVDVARAKQVAEEHGCAWTDDWRHVVACSDVDVVVVSTVNKALAPVTIAAAEAGKHVLCEKPLGRNYSEAQQIVAAVGGAGVLLKVGFNHRHHLAIWKAHELCTRGTVGPLMFIRAVYGHGGRPGYEKEWRGDPDLAGGGELLDQGVHIVDLCRWFMGDFAEVFGFISTYFWDRGYFGQAEGHPWIAQPSTLRPPSSVLRHQLEDNAFALLRTADGRLAQFHTSWTQWKNCFTFQVFVQDGSVRVDGLGGSYGTQTLTVGHRRPESGPPIEERFEFPGPDLSWQGEWQEFTSAIFEGRQPLANGDEGLQAMRLIAAIYESARTGQLVCL